VQAGLALTSLLLLVQHLAGQDSGFEAFKISLGEQLARLLKAVLFALDHEHSFGHGVNEGAGNAHV